MKAELDDYEKVPLTERWQRLQPPQIWKTRYRLVPIVAGLLVLNIILFLLLWWYLSASASKKHGHQSWAPNSAAPVELTARTIASPAVPFSS
jgi:hypothetical protein